jgi:hypothetical protein
MSKTLYVLVSGNTLNTLRSMGVGGDHELLESGDNYVIIGPVQDCAIYRFKRSDEWKCFDTLEEARQVASTLI